LPAITSDLDEMEDADFAIAVSNNILLSRWPAFCKYYVIQHKCSVVQEVQKSDMTIKAGILISINFLKILSRNAMLR